MQGFWSRCQSVWVITADGGYPWHVAIVDDGGALGC